jgi:molybdate transport system substrate-binding protein
MMPAVVLALALTCAAPQQNLLVAAAADLQFVMPALVDAFVAEHPDIKLDVATGSSGAFFAQVQRGAPFDLFLSADVDYVDKLIAAGLAADRFVYGQGRLVLYTPPGAPRSAVEGIAILSDPRITRIALANPRHAPYGRAAASVLAHSGLTETTRARLVLGENVAQAAHFVDSGAADAGFLPLAFVLSPSMKGRGAFVELPAAAYAPLVQGGCVVLKRPNEAAARMFRAFLLGEKARGLLAAAGFVIPGATTTSPTSTPTASTSASTPPTTTSPARPSASASMPRHDTETRPGSP